ncbi:MAG: hypothetical protein ACXWBP_12890, partial [Limisphaerales bacterium]
GTATRSIASSKSNPDPTRLIEKIECRSPGAPLASSKGNLVLKYFLVRKAERSHRQGNPVP